MTVYTTLGLLAGIETITIASLPIARLDRQQTADLMIRLVSAHQPGHPPVLMTSANGEVISRCAINRETDRLFRQSPVISADGQPMVLLSRLLCKKPLTERVATTDLVHDVARHPGGRDVTFYLLGASEEENALAAQRLGERYPHVRIVGRSHGYLKGDDLKAKIAEINKLAPDIVWLAMGVPREQELYREFADKLTNVAIVKTSGGLFNFLSGTRPRAPQWMQSAGLEWLFRLAQEPRRLFWRYAITSPHAIWLMLLKSA